MEVARTLKENIRQIRSLGFLTGNVSMEEVVDFNLDLPRPRLLPAPLPPRGRLLPGKLLLRPCTKSTH